MSRFHCAVPLRWADMDAFRHVNHAAAVTLLEQARVRFVFHEADGHGAGAWSAGLLVAALSVRYRAQIPYRGQSVLVAMWVEPKVRAASFVIRYELRAGPGEEDPVAITADTQMVPFDLLANRPRRLTDEERAFLARWADEPVSPR